MSARKHPADRGMHAVARVREVRERDSRLGLLQATALVRQREEEVQRLRAALDDAATRETATMAEFVVARHLLGAMAVAVREAEQRLDAGRTVATEAHSRWAADKARVKAIEHLLQRRAEQRAEERDRAEARESDDIAGRLHSRHQAALEDRQEVSL